jgi:hypothetical protein
MRASAVWFSVLLGSFGLSDSLMAQMTMVVLSPENGYYDEIESGVALRRTPIGGRGPLVGVNLVFSCGSCDVAPFDDAVAQIGGGSGDICGFSRSVPRQIVLNDLSLCVKSTITNNTFDLDLATWSDPRGCIDADGGLSCEKVDGLTAYLRSTSLTPTELLKQLIKKVKALNLDQGTETSLLTKLNTAWKKLDDANVNNDLAAIHTLQAFVHAVEAESAKRVQADDADELITDANEIISLLQSV